MKDSHNNVLPDVIEPAARWTDDCQGKKNYDGRLVSISTSYWPGPPYGPKPSARSSIELLFGEFDRNGYNYDAYFMLTEKTFEGDTEEDVKTQVEAWVKEQANAVRTALVGLFRKE